jgi:hypothetical protein
VFLIKKSKQQKIVINQNMIIPVEKIIKVKSNAVNIDIKDSDIISVDGCLFHDVDFIVVQPFDNNFKAIIAPKDFTLSADGKEIKVRLISKPQLKRVLNATGEIEQPPPNRIEKFDVRGSRGHYHQKSRAGSARFGS